MAGRREAESLTSRGDHVRPRHHDIHLVDGCGAPKAHLGFLASVDDGLDDLCKYRSFKDGPALKNSNLLPLCCFCPRV